jgi:hypothetical protein
MNASKIHAYVNPFNKLYEDDTCRPASAVPIEELSSGEKR